MQTKYQGKERVKKVLYSAIDEVGSERSGYVDAKSNRDAIELLTNDGLSEIKLHDDGALAIRRDDLNELSEDELEAKARFELKVRSKPSFTSFIMEVLRVNRSIILIGLALFFWGLSDENYYLLAFGAAVSLSMPLLSIWNYRTVSNYDRLLRAFAEGEWDKALSLIELLRKHMKLPEMEFDLDIRKASINSANGSLDSALQSLERWRSEFEEVSPGMYESRVASVYLASGHHEEYVDSMRDAFFKSSQSQTLILDLALAEARLGDHTKAELLLKAVNMEELPIYGVPFIEWVKGAIEKKNGSADAEFHLALAVSGFLEMGENPAVWTSLAVCIGDYASCLTEEQSNDKAQQLLESVWTILNVHGEESLTKGLLLKYPNLASS